MVPGKVSTKHKESSKQKKTGSRKLIGVFRGSLDVAAGPTAGVCVTRTSYAIYSSVAGEEGHKFIFSGRKSKKYVQEMDGSKVHHTEGNTPWTRRFFDSVVECIPAVLSIRSPSRLSGYWTTRR